MTNSMPYSENERKKKSVGTVFNNHLQICLLEYIPLEMAATFSLQDFIVTDLGAFINRFLINPASGYTRSEEIKISVSIGGKIPADNTPSYKNAVKVFTRIVKHCRTLELEVIDEFTAWLKGGTWKVKIRNFWEGVIK